VRTVIALGQSLGLEVVAEGVENRATAQMLSALACEELQGFYFSRPLPVPELERWAHAYLGADPLWRPGTAVARNSSMVVVSSSPCMM
jgi:EAL domain-containing protein (putative c-di-GMP-specific phosphodiesterase class I)